MKGITPVISACLLVQLLSSTSFAQKKVIVLGSSTAAGFGASTYDSSWVGRLQLSFRKNTSDGVDTIVDNRGAGGYTTYQSMPTDYQPPTNRPAPDPNANITYVLNSNPRPDVVIINYPTNDIVNGYTPEEMMNNLRLMFNQLNSNGIRTFISTTQPRNTATDAQRTLLRQLVDSIEKPSNFGLFYINFWDDLVTTDGTNMLRADLTPDGTHPNDQGHRYLFQRVQAKNIFAANSPLPLAIQNWQSRLENNLVRLTWHTLNEESGTRFEIERSANGRNFQTLQLMNGKGHDGDYAWTDASPLRGNNFYRLKIVGLGQTIYTRILPVVIDQRQLITSFYVDGATLHLQIQPGTDKGSIEIINSSGATLKKKTYTTADNVFSVPISELPAGDYFLRVTTSSGLREVERFAKLK